MSSFFKLAAMKKAMKEECTHLHCIHFIVFCAVTCNGSSVILEIMRRASETFGLHESNEILHDDSYGILKANDLYSTLFEVSQSELFMATGSCNYPRHTYSSKNVPFVTRSDMEKSENAMTQVTKIIENYSQDIRSLNQTNCQTKIHSMQEELEAVTGIGPFNVHHVIHLSAFLGLLPLKALQYASLLPTKSSSSDGRGPVLFIRKTCIPCDCPLDGIDLIPIEHVQQIFEDVFEELFTILGKSARFDKQFFENMLCELNRIYDTFQSKMKFKKIISKSSGSTKVSIFNIPNCILS